MIDTSDQHASGSKYDADDTREEEEETKYLVKRDDGIEREMTRDIGNPNIWYDSAGNKYYSGNGGRTFEEL